MSHWCRCDPDRGVRAVIPSRRAAVQIAYLLRRRSLRLLRWSSRGVKVAVFDRAGASLLVRNGYGRSDHWVLPGGGVGWRETPEVRRIAELCGERALDGQW
jgi:hypothetical protein